MPNTKEELYLAAILGEYSGELPLPNTKVECYLYRIATDGVPGGGETVDLSEYAKKEELLEIENDVEKLLNDSSRHVHTNIQSLMEITAADITSLHRIFPNKIYEIEQSLSDYATKEEVAQAIEKVVQLEINVSQLNRKTIKLRHGKGTFKATAIGTNIVWKYGSHEIQGESCTFDVKSDNGLIVIEFDEMTSLSSGNDNLNKFCLSDLKGNFIYLYLSNCSQITGDLSDLGGNIKSYLGVSNCSQITGIYNVISSFPKTINLSGTAITALDMDQNLINAANSTTKDGIFTATNMTRTAASDDAITTLVSNGWTVSGLTKVEV